MPPATASLMYAPEIYGRSDVGHIRIDKESKLIPSKAAKKAALSLLENKKLLMSIGIILVLIVITFLVLRRKGVTLTSIKNKLKRKPPSNFPPTQNEV